MSIIISQKPAKSAPLERLAVSPKEAAAMLGVSERTIRNWSQRGIFTPRRCGGRLFYSIESLRQFLDGESSESAESPIM